MRPVSTGGVSYAKTCGKRVPGEERAKSGDPQEGTVLVCSSCSGWRMAAEQESVGGIDKKE